MADTKTVAIGAETVQVSQAPGMKNWRTLAFNGAWALGLAAATWVVGVDWTQYISPTWAMVVVLGGNAVLRFFTNGPVMSDVSVKVK